MSRLRSLFAPAHPTWDETGIRWSSTRWSPSQRPLD